MNRVRSGGAFTLLEVLVALAILASGAVVLGGAYANVLLASGRLADDRDGLDALALAESAARATDDVSLLGRGGGYSLPGGGALRWRAALEPAGVPDLFRLTLHYERTGPDGVRAERGAAVRLVLEPGWSRPEQRARQLAEFRERLARARRQP